MHWSYHGIITTPMCSVEFFGAGQYIIHCSLVIREPVYLRQFLPLLVPCISGFHALNPRNTGAVAGLSKQCFRNRVSIIRQRHSLRGATVRIRNSIASLPVLLNWSQHIEFETLSMGTDNHWVSSRHYYGFPGVDQHRSGRTSFFALVKFAMITSAGLSVIPKI